MTSLVRFTDLTGRDHWINPAHVAHVQDAANGRCVIRLVEGLGVIGVYATADEVAVRLRTLR